MKKLQQTLVTLAAVIAPLAMVPSASAASTCQNGYTGPNSDNLCTSTTTYTCTQKDDNHVTINNDGTQVAVSGDGTSSGNTSGGDVQSGTASNNNGVTFNVTLTNDKICTVTATVPATPETPPAGGSGAVGGQGAAAPAKQTVAAPKTTTPRALANTSGDATLGYVAGAIALFGGAIAASRLAVSTYGRMKL
jgi:hypothetical protein